MPPPSQSPPRKTRNFRGRATPPQKALFEVQLFLQSNGMGGSIGKFRRKETIYSEDDSAKNVIYVHEDGVRLTVINTTGKEAVVEILAPCDFYGARSFENESVYTATAIMAGDLGFALELGVSRPTCFAGRGVGLSYHVGRVETKAPPLKRLSMTRERAAKSFAALHACHTNPESSKI